MTLLDRVFPPDQCELMVGLPPLRHADDARNWFALQGLTTIDNEGRTMPISRVPTCRMGVW